MRYFEDVIIRPHITEKTNLMALNGKYTFIVHPDSNKTEIKHACEHLFNVKVLDVSTMNYKGKLKRLGVHEGKRPRWKKAVVTIDLDPKAEEYLVKGGKAVAGSKKYKNSIDEFGAMQ